MTRDQLEHLIRAAATISGEDDIVVIGSQAILGQFPGAPESMRVSMVADLFPLANAERAEVIDGSIGELSPFHETFGYYAHGVAEETAQLPPGWRDRLVVIENENTRGARGWCLEIHDLLASKLLAGREKDLVFLREAADHRLAMEPVLLQRLATMPLAPALLQLARARIKAAFAT